MRVFLQPKEVCSLLGMTYRTIQYWDVTGFISPSMRRAGKYRLYNFADLFKLYIVRRLRSNGYSVQRIRKLLPEIVGMVGGLSDPNWSSTVAVWGDKVVVMNGECLFGTKAQVGLITISSDDLEDLIRELLSDSPGVIESGSQSDKPVEAPDAVL